MNIASRIKAHRVASRARRDFANAVSHASTPALRDELITLAQIQNRVQMR